VDRADVISDDKAAPIERGGQIAGQMGWDERESRTDDAAG
jgi:hypothetical protein